MRQVDITGQVFGRLTAIKRAETRIDGTSRYRSMWWVRCSCGTEKMVCLDHLNNKSKGVRSCGCLAVESLKTRCLTHGMTRTSTYRSWSHAKGRCETPTDPKYYCYGARGIKMCERWSSSFANFFADMGSKPDGLTLERKDVNKGYSPDNCIWASAHVQARSRSDNVIVLHAGKSMVLMDYARAMDVSCKPLYHRVSKGQDARTAAIELKLNGSRFVEDHRKRHK